MSTVRIGEVARRAGVSTKALRFYEQAGVLPEPARTPSGYRDYDSAALGRLRFVKAAQGAGLTLAEIVQIVAVREAQGPPCAHVVALLDWHAAELDRRISHLTSARADIDRLRTRADHLDPAACTPEGVCHVIPTSSEPPRHRSALHTERRDGAVP